MPALYTRLASIEEMAGYSVARVLDLFGPDVPARRWEGMTRASATSQPLARDLVWNAGL